MRANLPLALLRAATTTAGDDNTQSSTEDVATALKRMESRQVFGKIVVYF